MDARETVNHRAVGKYWNGNAEAWTRLARAGYDVSRDYLNTPAFLAMLPPIRGLRGLDIGCGEGHNTRLLAEQGARMTAIDVADVFIGHAAATEQAEPLGIAYSVASAVALPFPDAAFDFATGFMSFMDISETELVLAEAYRVLRPGGFLQFSITHPCFDTPHRRKVFDVAGKPYAFEVGGYFDRMDGEIEEWIFGAAPAEAKQDLPEFKVPRFHRTLSEWLNLLLDTGFQIERVGEPCPDEALLREQPHFLANRVVASFLHLRARKPAQPMRKEEMSW